MATFDELVITINEMAEAAGLMPGSRRMVGAAQIDRTHRLALKAQRLVTELRASTEARGSQAGALVNGGEG